MLLVSALLLAMWTFIGFWSWSQRTSTLASNRAILEQLTSATEEQTLRLFKQAETSLVVSSRWMTDHPSEDPGESRAFIELVERLRRLSDGLLDIRMVSRTGGLEYIPRRSAAPLADVSDRDYFRAQFGMDTRGFFIADPVVSRVTGKWGIPVSIPIDTVGSKIAVLFAAIELDRIAAVFDAERIKPTGTIVIYRSDGTFLFRTPMDDRLVGRSIVASASWSDHISLAERGVFLSDSRVTDGQPRLVSFAHLRDYPLVVVVTAGLDDLLAPWWQTTMTLTIVGIVVTLGSLFLGTGLYRAMKAEERAVRETERAHRDARLILSAAGEGICGLDATGRIGFINPAAKGMLGWAGSDPVGRDLHGASHHRHKDGTPYAEDDCPVVMTLRDGLTREVQDEVFWRANGTHFPVEFVVTGVIEDGRVTGAVLVFRDVSERQESERALLAQASELARSNADLEQFAYVASHDLREPLRQVSSYVSLLERRYGQALDEDGREFIRYARDGAKRMDHLIIDLLEFSRIGHSALPVEKIDLGEIIDQAVELLGARIIEAGASVQRASDMPFVRAARDDLMRLFQNLIGNAIKYRHPARSSMVRIICLREGNEIVVSVMDNGIGIEADYTERIFGIFQRLHTRDKFEGTGIGLAICKKIVEHQGGRIWVDSVPGEGSNFHVALPVAE